MPVLLLTHIVLAAVILGFRRRLGRGGMLLAAAGPLATLTLAALRAEDVIGGDRPETLWTWVESMGLEFVVRLDGLGLLMLFVIGGAGTAIFLHAWRYFSPTPAAATFAGVITLFAGSMVGLVLADDIWTLFVFWELTTVTSYLLIGHNDRSAEARSAALHAALVTGAGGLAMLGGLAILASQIGSTRISDIVAAAPASGILIDTAWALVLVGAVTKSAQFPFHGWLPGAMAAPTPASAFLHSATMVKAGVILVGRLAPGVTAEWWTPAVLTIGFITMAFGGWRALRQTDLKLLLAYGTVAQLGFLFALVGSGSPELVFGGLAVLAAHAAFKAALFMTVGTIDHEAGTRDLRRLDGLARHRGLLILTMAAAFSMAGVPLTFGFVAKEAAFDGLGAAIGIAAFASALTAAYTVRFLTGAFGPADPGVEPARLRGRIPTVLMWAPGVLAFVGVLLGLVPGLVTPLVETASRGLTQTAGAGKLVVWPGLVAPLAWSAASVVIGGAAGLRRPFVDRITGSVGRATTWIPSADTTFDRAVKGLVRWADRITSVLQNGSLPSYLGVIALVAVVLPTAGTLSLSPEFPALPEPGTTTEVIVAAVTAVAAIALVMVRRRFAAVLLLGAVGYGIAGLFALFGGPDLALTQLLVETLAVTLFALVLRFLPSRFTTPTGTRLARGAIAGAVGLFAMAAAWITSSAGAASPVSDEYLALALPEGGGRNVVNVILTDFRAFDTFGEITVLVVAAVGVSGLIVPLLRSRHGRSEEVEA